MGPAEEMAKIIQTVEGAADVRAEATEGLPQITVIYQREKLAKYGLNIDKLNKYVSTAFAGANAGIIFEGEKRFDLVVRFAANNRESIEDLKNGESFNWTYTDTKYESLEINVRIYNSALVQ